MEQDVLIIINVTGVSNVEVSESPGEVELEIDHMPY